MYTNWSLRFPECLFSTIYSNSSYFISGFDAGNIYLSPEIHYTYTCVLCIYDYHVYNINMYIYLNYFNTYTYIYTTF